jgi:hypothetical protein
MNSSAKTNRRAEFFKLAQAMGQPQVSLLAGSPSSASLTARHVAHGLVGGLPGQTNASTRVPRLATMLDQLVAADLAAQQRRASGE